MKIILIALGWLAVLMALVPLPLLASEAEVKSQVAVDMTGKDSADAKSQAMAKGQIDALIELLAKLTPPGQAQDIVDTLDGKKIAALVHGTEVLDEKITTNRYRANLSISFDADEIGALISKFNAGIAKQEVSVTTGSFLIIPAFEDESGPVLWEDINPWRSTWKAVGLEVTSGDIIVPYGDANDASIIDTKTAASATYNSLAPMALRYGVSDIVILQAKFTANPDMAITIVKRRLNRTRNEVNMQTYRADPQETRDALLTRAARDIIYNLQNKKTEEISNSQGVRGGERNKVMALASITTMASWTQLRAKLATLPMIDRLELLAFSPQQVDVIIHYRGSAESLANAMVAQKIRLVQNKDYWVLSND